MVKLTTITTKTGDRGETGLIGGTRVDKCSLRVEAIGAVDEVNAAIGLLRSMEEAALFQDALSRIQHDLFDMGADLATLEPRKDALRIISAQTERLEAEMAHWAEQLAPLSSFILPGGTPFAARCHWVRVVARRAERVVCALIGVEKMNPEIMCYLNRLSDYFFQLARVANDCGRDDILWEPGRNR